jgi:NAD dependent epimerase/dehydratase family
MWNAGPEAARIIEVYTPGGFELFFKDFGKRLRQGPIGLNELNRFGEPHGIRFFDDWIPELKAAYNLRLIGKGADSSWAAARPPRTDGGSRRTENGMDTVMVTGDQGFTDRHITARLRASGGSVVSYNRDFDSREDGVVMVQGELFDVPRLVRVLQQHGIAEIVHTAAMSHPKLSLEFPIGTFAANFDGTVALFQAARLAGVKCVVNFSSEAVYGAVDGAVTEDLPPSTTYESNHGVARTGLHRPVRASKSCHCASLKSTVRATECPNSWVTCSRH